MLKYYDFSGVSFLVDKRFKCEIASENASARFDLVHNPTVPYLTDSKFTPFSAPSRGRLYIYIYMFRFFAHQSRPILSPIQKSLTILAICAVLYYSTVLYVANEIWAKKDESIKETRKPK